MKSEMRDKLAQLPFEEKIRKVGELIRLRQKIKSDPSNISEEAALLASLDKAAAELNAGKGVPMERVRENIRECATSPETLRNEGPHFPVPPACHVVALAKMEALAKAHVDQWSRWELSDIDGQVERPKVSGSQRVNTTNSSGRGRVDDVKGHPQGELRGLTKLVKITEDLRKYAAEQGIGENEALEKGLRKSQSSLSRKVPKSTRKHDFVV